MGRASRSLSAGINTITITDKDMNFDNISSAMMLIYDELSKDKKSKSLIKQIDAATDDSEIKKGIVAGVGRLRKLGKNSLADEVEKKTKGFAF